MLESYGMTDAEVFTESVTEIKHSTANMQTLIENLLFLARADQGTQPLNMAPVELNAVVEGAAKSFNSPRVTFTNTEPLEITADAGLLERMFSAIISNALTYTSGAVTVTLRTLNSGAEVAITDSGAGIAPENIDKIFDRFYKADAARTNPDAEKISAGLGLSIAKWIADAHGITISVTSEVGVGSVFTLTIPRKQI